MNEVLSKAFPEAYASGQLELEGHRPPRLSWKMHSSLGHLCVVTLRRCKGYVGGILRLGYDGQEGGQGRRRE
ncbi:hypothetical protein [Streptomyces sp. NPDC056921]|uniref:hypothetical protein n=1 Tax=Streptomyces sp. NPDC056921 TaxID=3345966 RepID=UPI0036425202